MKKFGFVAIVGRPNAGKSTLLNLLLQEPLCPVSPMPQTTRQTLRGILTEERGQAVFVDTPGIHQGKYKLNQAMADAAEHATEKDAADTIIYIVDLSRPPGEEERLAARTIRSSRLPVLILFNKSDLVEDTNTNIRRFFASFPEMEAQKWIAASAIRESERTAILDAVFDALPTGQPHFPEEYHTDANLRFLAAELIRYQVIHNTQQEVPHATAVSIDQWEETESGAQIKVSLVVETSGQKAILIGPGGARIKKIRQFSRREIKKVAGTPIALELFVKVRPKWRNNPSFLREMGFEMPKPKKRKRPGKRN